MSEVDDYFATLDEGARAAFERIRGIAMELVPDAMDGKSYGMAALMYKGKPLVAFLAAKQHLSLFPCSGAVVESVQARLPGYDVSKGTIRFRADHPLPDDVVRDVVRLRKGEIDGGRRR